jgi:type IV pilus assembly protein PilA
MIQRISDRLHREDKGFTLIELMVVVLIIAILIAIAIPTFLGARRRAQDRAAQSSDRNAVTAAKAVFTDKEDYSQATASNNQELKDGEPALQFTDTGAIASTDQIEVSATSEAVGTSVKDNRFVSAALSDSGVCWFAQDVAGPAGTANAGTTWARSETAGCAADNAPAYDNAAWARRPGDAVNF